MGPSFKQVIKHLKTKSKELVEIEVHRPGTCLPAGFDQKCVVTYRVGKTGLMNQHMAHLSALEFALHSGCALHLARVKSRESFAVSFSKARFNPVPFESL